jgi:hypothetical protein
MSAATPDIRPDLDALITLLDDLLAKVEAGAVFRSTSVSISRRNGRSC